MGIASIANADVIISNLSATVGAGSNFGTVNTQYKAFGFTIGANPEFLAEVELTMDFTDPNPLPVVSIRTDNGGVPGIELMELNNQTSLIGQGQFVFTTSSFLPLAANTTYWLHVRSEPTTGPAFAWDGTAQGVDPTGSATTYDYVFNGTPSPFRNRLEIRSPESAGAAFCDPANNNSTGLPTRLVGSVASGLSSGIHLDANQGPPTQFGYLLIGTGSNDPGTMIGNGRLCLQLGAGSSIGRYNAAGTLFNSSGQFDAAGVFQNIAGTSSSGLGFDVPLSLPIAGTPQIMVGETWHFQMWHREPGGQSNFSNGLSVTF